jgi:hypothetical protein
LFVYDCASLNYVVVHVLVSPEVECHVSSLLSVPDDGHAGNAFSAADMSCCQLRRHNCNVIMKVLDHTRFKIYACL